MKKKIKFYNFVLLSMVILSSKLNATTDISNIPLENELNLQYNFKCEYNLNFNDDGNKYKITLFYYDSDVNLYYNLNELKNSTTFSQNGINDSATYLQFNKKDFVEKFNEANFICPNIYSKTDTTSVTLYPYEVVDTGVIINMPNNSEAIINPKLSDEKKAQLLDKKNGIQECDERVYLAPGGIITKNLLSSYVDKDFLFDKQLSFTMKFDKKYNKRYIVLYYGDNSSQTELYDENTDLTFSLGNFDSKHDIMIMFLGKDNWGNGNECPKVNDGYNCRYVDKIAGKSTLLFTKTVTSEVCAFPKQSSQTVDKATAEIKYEITRTISRNKSTCLEILATKNDNLVKFLQNAWTIIKIASIILTILLSILDLMNVITKDKDNLKSVVNKCIRRLVIVLIILLIPTIIDMVGSMFGVDDILCGIK